MEEIEVAPPQHSDSPKVELQDEHIEYQEGGTYDGFTKDNKRHGNGTMVYPNGDTYVGEWKEDKREGQGTLTAKDGTEYSGEWSDDKRHGNGAI